MDCWQHSRPIDAEAIKKTPSFTTLPIRINERTDVADSATRRALRDWDHCLHDGLADKALISISELGNLGAFAYPEVPPERLAILTYLTDLGMLHDDGYEAMDMDQARAEHRDFGALFDPDGQPLSSRRSTRAPKLKKLVSQILLEAIRIDRDLGGKEGKAPQFNSLEEYQAYRRDDFGIRRDPISDYLRAFWPMVEFGMAMRLSDEDKKLIEPVMEPIDKAIIWTNDYWSFDREYHESVTSGSRLTNVVEVVRRTENISINEAKAKVRQLLVDLEQQYLERKSKFFAQNPSLPFHVRKWVEVAGITVAGTHYWASCAPRHHTWRNHSINVQDPNESNAHRGYSTETDMPNNPSFSNPSSEDAKLTPARLNPEINAQEFMNLNAQLALDKHDIEQFMRAVLAILSKVVKHCESLFGGRDHEEAKLPQADEATKRVVSFKACSKETQEAEGLWYKPTDTALQAPIQYICSMPSKGVRSRMIEALNYWLEVDEASLNKIGQLVDILHNASLILDDIEDNSPKRRGKPATHTIFGHSQAINSANFMFVQAVQVARQFRSPNAVEILLEELENLYLGQSWDLCWKYKLKCPSPSEYLNMVDNKTGGLFRLLLRLMQAEGKSTAHDEVNMNGLTILFGRFFQIRDDYMNLRSGLYIEQKGFCEDLDEGKFSYPIVHCAANHAGFRDLIDGVFRQRPTTITTSGMQPLALEVKQHIVEYLDTTGTFQHCREYLLQLERSIICEIDRIEKVTNEANPMLRLLLEKLSVKYD
ncbi:bifunctional terpene synthase/polyprenyl synthetase family protein [Aspergillus vadensis CBS 113365]|uniref:Geranylgeranyl pyrophosphate synthase n=1 Tax=Aspergillus vadensis (strain CBS 113365 / IMI 142717 / IBT 24658) TaxID=1448311 RepID=A0A319BBT1_ASPVC|nr:geranylgeranyl pyrophosphate synthase [Aspergillus vadensis CBS 113365]PYH70516.1 geranylgeranyl pyrophosphate synthase [Aspergillus vadensis CBS 113365]